MTAQPDSNAPGLAHPPSDESERWTAGRGRCRTVEDRLGSRGVDPVACGLAQLAAVVGCLGKPELGQELHLVEVNREAGEPVTGNPKYGDEG
jgi:hypothetical protein